jgi:hypothetical protein
VVLLLGFCDVKVERGLLNFFPDLDFLLLRQTVVLTSGLLGVVLLGDAAVEVDFQGMVHVAQLALHGTVPMVLDCVVGAAVEDLRDVGPFVVELAVHQEQNPLLLATPVNFFDARIQVVVPALAALLAHPSRQVLCNRGPSLGALLLHELQHTPVLFLGPGAFNQLNTRLLPDYSSTYFLNALTAVTAEILFLRGLAASKQHLLLPAGLGAFGLFTREVCSVLDLEP